MLWGSGSHERKKTDPLGSESVYISQNVRLRSVPVKLSTSLVLGDACLEEVLLFGQVHCFAHPREWIDAVVLNWQADTLQPAISNVLAGRSRGTGLR